jgi:hypothetical protein
MQTFMPSQDFNEVAKVLDNKRLNKQALEGWQILMNLLELDPEGNHRPAKGWSNHPAVKMWKGHEVALYMYIEAMTKEWLKRGYKTTIADKARQTLNTAISKGLLEPISTLRNFPLWIQLEEVLSSHRTALLAKNYEWYSQFGWPEDPGYPITKYTYVWPIKGES